MKTKKGIIKLLFTWFILPGVVIFALLLLTSNPAHASTPAPLPTPPGPDRYTSMSVGYTKYEWWMAAWQSNLVYCSFYTDHDGLPTDVDISSACGTDLYNNWINNSSPCAETDVTLCKGFYLTNVSNQPDKREITIKLPAPSVQISLENCEPDSSGWCTQQPHLVLSANEPLPNEKIISINGLAGTDPFVCKNSRCVFKLSGTSPTGVHVSFWTYSTYGDSSKVFDALLRVISDDNSPNRLTPRWYVDVMSSQWIGPPPASCAVAWESFPPVDGLPQWLTTPSSSEKLKSNIPYNYLAANLIKQGAANASECPNGGLFPDGSVNACGLEKAAKNVDEWQNRFDNLIFKVAQEDVVPAQLLKNIFSQESQFWPGVFRNGKDVGLGQMTKGGADTTLLWNPSFYGQFCPLVLDRAVCRSKGFANLSSASQELLRGALVGSVDARCENCPLGLDLSRADFSVGIFAHSLLANCEQAGRIVRNITGEVPGHKTNYETLWLFTLVNYNAGSGCLSDALTQAYDASIPNSLNWERVAGALNVVCPGASDYVNKVISDPPIDPLSPAPETAPGQTPG